MVSEQEVNKAMCSIVTIIHEKEEGSSFGSGFVIKTRGAESVIITCRHCVKDFQQNHTLRIRYVVGEDVRELPAAILYVSNTAADVALIRVDGLSALVPLRFSERKMLIGQNTVTIGNCRPENLWEEEEDEYAIPKFHASCPGLVKEFRPRPGVAVVVKGVGVSGMSGGPTLSRRGISGMLTDGRPGQTISLTTEAIKVVLKGFLASRAIPFEEKSTIHQVLHIMPTS